MLALGADGVWENECKDPCTPLADKTRKERGDVEVTTYFGRGGRRYRRGAQL